MPAQLAPLPGLSWSLATHQQPISFEPHAVILTHLSAQTAIPYWISWGHLTTALASLVDWSLLAHALSLHLPTYWMWLSKFASGHSAVKITMQRWKQWDSLLCPICHLADKDTNHVILCSDAKCTAPWHTLVNTLRQWLTLAKTHPAISCSILTTLHGHSNLSFAMHAHPSCLPPSNAQDTIRFFGFLLGHLSPCWECLQAQYSHQQGHTSLASSWAKGLCLQLLHLYHAMWLFCNHQVQTSLTAVQHVPQQPQFSKNLLLVPSTYFPKTDFIYLMVLPLMGLLYSMSSPSLSLTNTSGSTRCKQHAREAPDAINSNLPR